MHSSPVLSFILLFPLCGLVCLLLLPKASALQERIVAGISTGSSMVFSFLLLTAFDPKDPNFQFRHEVFWLPSLGVRYVVGLDGLSMWMILLTSVLTFLVVVSSGSIHKYHRGYLQMLLLLEIGMLGTFIALEAVTFYVFWEAMLVPMYFLIGIWGGQERRIYAAVKFVLYTALGSLLMLVAIVYLGYQTSVQLGLWSFVIADWRGLSLSWSEEVWLFTAFALAFSIKIPLFPLHTWLPDAHVEAPTGGSVILAGVLLKMGIYGLMRFCVPVFPEVVIVAAPVFCILGIIGIVYGALVAWMQTDLKKLVAYSSVSHLGFCVLGFASLNLEGMQGSILQMINHGISTGALFFLVGVLYDRKHSRLISDYRGLAGKIPAFSVLFMIFTLSSVGLPLTNGFVGEFLILYGSFKAKPLYAALAVLGVVLGAVYMLSLYRRVIFGVDEAKGSSPQEIADVTTREGFVLLPLAVLVFLLGLFPNIILSSVEETSRSLVGYLQKASESSEIVLQEF